MVLPAGASGREVGRIEINTLCTVHWRGDDGYLAGVRLPGTMPREEPKAESRFAKCLLHTAVRNRGLAFRKESSWQSDF